MIALCLLWAALAPAGARADWVEPVFGPVNQTNAFANGIRGNGSEALVALTQLGPQRRSGTFPSSLQVASLRSSSWQLSPPVDRTSTMSAGGVPWPLFTSSGPVYATWSEQADVTGVWEVFLDRYLGGGTWAPVGGSLGTASTLSSPTVANVYAAPWVAWQQGDGSIRVVRMSGSHPSDAGAPIPTGGAPASPSMVAINGVPYLAFGRSDGIHVAKFTHGRWSELPGLPAPGGFSPTITSVAGRIFLAWSQGAANGHIQLHAARYVGNGHWFASQSLNIDANEDARGPQITSVGDVPWLVWSESSRPYANAQILEHVFVKQFNGTSWTQVGGPLNVDVNQSAVAGGISDVAGNAWVAMTQYQTDGGTAVRVKEALGFEPHVSSVTTRRAHTGRSRATRFSIALSEPGTVRLEFTQTVKGRLDGGVCVAATKRNARSRACPLAISRGQATFRGSAGANTFVFNGTVSKHHHLKKGVYTVLISAISATGLRSASQSVRVTI